MLHANPSVFCHKRSESWLQENIQLPCIEMGGFPVKFYQNLGYLLTVLVAGHECWILSILFPMKLASLQKTNTGLRYTLYDILGARKEKENRAKRWFVAFPRGRLIQEDGASAVSAPLQAQWAMNRLTNVTVKLRGHHSVQKSQLRTLSLVLIDLLCPAGAWIQNLRTSCSKGVCSIEKDESDSLRWGSSSLSQILL